MRIAVVGGGVVGLCCAYELQRSGAEVVVVERDLCGGAASLGNAGWIVPSYSAPIPAPGVMRQAFRWILDRDSPLRVRPRLDPDFLRWSWQFWRDSTRQRFEKGIRALLNLNEHTMRLFDSLRQAGVGFEMHSTGLLIATLSKEALEEVVEEHYEVEKAGYEGETELLDHDAVRHLEPALSDRVAGGLHLKTERYVRPESFTAGLVDYLNASGVGILENNEVRALARNGRHGWRIHTSRDELEADGVIVAAGVWSARLLAKLGMRLPLEAARGCSVTASDSGIPPNHALKFAEASVTCSPFENGVRVTGTLDLTGKESTLDRRRLETVIRSAKPYLHDWEPNKPDLEWAGLRPMTPDSLALIGAVPGLDRLYVATGHGQLGVTLAPATAAKITPLVLEDILAPELEPFRVDRF